MHLPINVRTTNRIPLLDFIRGFAIALMFVFHISFGLSEMGVFDVDFSEDYFWISFRTIIVFLFLTLVGIGIALSNNKNKKPLNSKFLKRLFLLFVYMMLISFFSYYVRPQYYVYFGILHLIFVASILGRLLINYPLWFLLSIALFSLALGLTVDSGQLNHPLIYWLGLGNTPPVTDDFAPLFPWFSLVIFGIIIGKYLITSDSTMAKLQKWQAQNWLSKVTCWAGNYSIHLYFIHFQFFYLLVFISNY